MPIVPAVRGPIFEGGVEEPSALSDPNRNRSGSGA